MNMKQKGSAVMVGLLIFLVVGLIAVTGWLVFDGQRDANNNGNTTANNPQVNKPRGSDNIDKLTKEIVKTSIYPNDSTGNASKDFYTVILPSGWSVETVYEQYDIVKTIGNDKYLISSFIEEDTNRNIMEQRVAEGIETITSDKTSSGTSISVLKTPTTLFLASCKPTGENCYLQLNRKKLYIHLYKVIPGAQSLTDTDYPEEIINDFESIAKSLSI